VGTFRGIYQHRTLSRDLLDQLREPEGGMSQELIKIFFPLIIPNSWPSNCSKLVSVQSYSYNKTKEMH